MSILPRLAWRFLFSKSSDGFLSFIAWVSVTGVSLGVLALVVVTSVINGFEGELIRVISGMNGDVILYTRGNPVKHTREIEEKIRSVVPQTTQTTASFVTELMVAGDKGVSGAVLEGVDFSTVDGVTDLSKRVIKGHLPSPDRDSSVYRDYLFEVALGKAIAEKVGVSIGDEMRLIVPFAQVEDDGQRRARIAQVKVVGIVKMGMHQYDSKFVYASLAAVQNFMTQPGKVTSFKIRLETGTNLRESAKRLGDNFGYPFRAKDWGQLNKNLLYAIELEKAVIAIILTVIVIVAAFNVVSTLMMMIHDKSREIAILKTMGFKPKQGFRLFTLIGVGIGIVGVCVGTLGGLLANRLLKNFQFVDLPEEIYHIGFLPVVEVWSEILVIVLVSLVICVLATLYPAFQVARRPPIEGLRYE